MAMVFLQDTVEDLDRHFLVSLASEARINLHAKVITGINDHHKVEALFKALGRALDSAPALTREFWAEFLAPRKLLKGRRI